MTDHYANAELYHWWVKQPKWRALVEQLKKEKHNQCELCGSMDDLVAHHTDYMWMMTEHEIKTLQLLCKSCHRKAHGMEEK